MFGSPSKTTYLKKPLDPGSASSDPPPPPTTNTAKRLLTGIWRLKLKFSLTTSGLNPEINDNEVNKISIFVILHTSCFQNPSFWGHFETRCIHQTKGVHTWDPVTHKCAEYWLCNIDQYSYLLSTQRLSSPPSSHSPFGQAMVKVSWMCLAQSMDGRPIWSIYYDLTSPVLGTAISTGQVNSTLETVIFVSPTCKQCDSLYIVQMVTSDHLRKTLTARN